MKKQLTVPGLLVLIMAIAAFTAFAPPQKDKKPQKEQQQNQGKKNEKGNQGKNDAKDKTIKNDDMKDNQGNDNKGRNGMNDDKWKNKDNKDNKGNDNADNNYKWDRETFKDRDKIKNKEKVNICHKFNRDGDPGVNIRVSANALQAHLNHGDVQGDCPAVTSGTGGGFSNRFLRRRNDYYNTLYNGQDQVVYSRSIMDYALERLVQSRLQLTQYQNNNMPLADIQRKQATVVELEQDVSLLETLIATAATLVVNKLF